MTTDHAQAHQAIQDAVAALRIGDKRTARRSAERAVFLAREREEPWLVLAEISSPRASIAYIQQALKINPSSATAIKALHRAQHRMNNQPDADRQKTRALSLGGASSANRASAQQPEPHKKSTPWIAAAGVFVILFMAVLAWYAWTRNFSSTGRAISMAPTHLPTLTFTPVIPPTSTAANIVIPTHTPVLTSTPTASPTSTFSPTPTATLKPSPTSSPTKVVHSQNIYTVKRGETLAKIAAKFDTDLDELMRVNNIDEGSTVKKGARLVIPPNTSVGAAQSKGASPPAPVRGSGKSILVDISKQHMYAYEGKKLILSFDVSTGRNGSTFTGTFSILDKIPNAWSAPWGFWMPNWMGIYYVGSNLENGFHSLPVLTNGAEIWGDEIGVPITYGCVVLDPGDMKRLFKWAEIGTPVVIQQ